MKVFENDVYGSLWSDSVPCTTVTIRPTFKTVMSVKTMLARELKWNQCSRKVDFIYNTLGQEITDVGSISNGDVIIASAGDRFVKPHSDLAERFPPPKVSVLEHKAGWASSDVGPTATTSAPEDTLPPSPEAQGANPPLNLAQLRQQRRAPAARVASGGARTVPSRGVRVPSEPRFTEEEEAEIAAASRPAVQPVVDMDTATSAELAEMVRADAEETRAFLAGQRERERQTEVQYDEPLHDEPAVEEPPKNETRAERIARLMVCGCIRAKSFRYLQIKQNTTKHRLRLRSLTNERAPDTPLDGPIPTHIDRIPLFLHQGGSSVPLLICY